MAVVYLFIAYVCMNMAVQHCLQFCTSFQSPMLIDSEADTIYQHLPMVAQLSRFPVRFPCALLSHCLHWCP